MFTLLGGAELGTETVSLCCCSAKYQGFHFYYSDRSKWNGLSSGLTWTWCHAENLKRNKRWITLITELDKAHHWSLPFRADCSDYMLNKFVSHRFFRSRLFHVGTKNSMSSSQMLFCAVSIWNLFQMFSKSDKSSLKYVGFFLFFSRETDHGHFCTYLWAALLLWPCVLWLHLLSAVLHMLSQLATAYFK